MKLLVLCSDYPCKDNPYKVAWSHARNVHYLASGLSVHVCNFATLENYEIDGVQVLSKESITDIDDTYDIVVSHSPNLRWHIPLLWKVKKAKVVLFFHGSESLYIYKDYPKPYYYNKPSIKEFMVRSVYDYIKMKALHYFINNKFQRVSLVFVSGWMKEMFEKNVHPLNVKHNVRVINNCLWTDFYSQTYGDPKEYLADFITLRRFDESKYSIDKVVEFASSNPQYSFHVYGQGDYFKHNEPPKNMTVFYQHIHQKELTALLSRYRYALMPTRFDAQGVMACEISAYGMPLITTDVDIMQEMLAGFENVKFLPLDYFNKKMDESELPVSSNGSAGKYRFSYDNTVRKEIELFLSL